MQKVVQYQFSSLKTHPHIIKCQIISHRLIQLVYHPKNIHSPLANYQFRLKIELPDDYPERPPTVKFVDPIEHINISERTGEIFMPILRQEWSSYISLYIIIDLIDTLLVEPETDAQYCANYKNSKNSNKKVETFKIKEKFSLPVFEGNMKEKYNQKNILSKDETSLNQQNSFSSLLQLSDQQKYKPIQAKKKKLLRMKTIILSKAEDFNDDYKEKGETQKQQYIIRQTPHLSKIKEENIKQNQKCQLKEFSTFHKNISSLNARSTQKSSFMQRSTSKLDLQTKIRGFQSPQPRNQQKIKKTQIQQQNSSMRESLPFQQIPTLKRNISQEMGSATINKEMTTTITLDRTTSHLDKISRTIKTFENQYENLINRRSKTNNSELIKIIDCKITEQIQMIKQLQELSSTLKKQMIKALKQQVIKQK